MYLVSPLKTFGCRAYGQPKACRSRGTSLAMVMDRSTITGERSVTFRLGDAALGQQHRRRPPPSASMSRRCERTTSTPRATAASTMTASEGVTPASRFARTSSRTRLRTAPDQTAFDPGGQQFCQRDQPGSAVRRRYSRRISMASMRSSLRHHRGADPVPPKWGMNHGRQAPYATPLRRGSAVRSPGALGHINPTRRPCGFGVRRTWTRPIFSPNR